MVLLSVGVEAIFVVMLMFFNLLFRLASERIYGVFTDYTHDKVRVWYLIPCVSQ